MIDVFPDLTETLLLDFSRTLFEGVFLKKLCIIITLLRAYQFISGLMTLAFFQGYRCVRIVCVCVCFLFLSTVV